MLRRFIFILILLTIVFFVYRKINPEGANNLVNKTRNTYNRILGKTEEISLLTGDIPIEEASGGIVEMTGDILTGSLLGGDAEIITEGIPAATGGLLDAIELDEITPTTVTEIPSGATVVTPSAANTPVTEAPASSTKTASKPAVSKDTQDTQNLINNLFK